MSGIFSGGDFCARRTDWCFGSGRFDAHNRFRQALCRLDTRLNARTAAVWCCLFKLTLHVQHTTSEHVPGTVVLG